MQETNNLANESHTLLGEIKNEYLVKNGTIRAIKPVDETKKLSPSKLRRKLKRATELDKLRINITTANIETL